MDEREKYRDTLIDRMAAVLPTVDHAFSPRSYPPADELALEIFRTTPFLHIGVKDAPDH